MLPSSFADKVRKSRVCINCTELNPHLISFFIIIKIMFSFRNAPTFHCDKVTVQPHTFKSKGPGSQLTGVTKPAFYICAILFLHFRIL